MGHEEVVEDLDCGTREGHNEGFKENTVQEILKESVAEEITQIIDTRPDQSRLCHVSEVTECLVLCSAASVNQKLLEMLNITCVVNAAPELPILPVDNTTVRCHRVAIADSSDSNIYQYFDQIADIIHQAVSGGRRALVFCVAGVSRSASLCIAYLMKHCGMSLFDAYVHLKQRRPKIRPNCSFFRQLIQYERALYATNTVEMVLNDLVRMEIPSVYECDYVNPFRKRRQEKNGRH